MNKFDSHVATIESNLSIVKGEVYKFCEDNKRKSISKARKALLVIGKVTKMFRKELQLAVNAIPRKRRNIDPERMKEIVAKRKATIAARKK